MSTIIGRMNAFNTMTAAKDYGTGECMHTVEVHILSWVASNPGISPVQVAIDWNRTKGAVSQIIKKLEEKGLLIRDREEGRKSIRLYVTEKGARLDQAHRAYDTQNYVEFLKLMGKRFSSEEIQRSFEMMEEWIELSMTWEPS